MNSRKLIAVIGCAALIMIAGTACGSGQEEATAETAIAETESLESSETESAETETESIIEDTTIDEAEAKKMLKEYSDQIAEANIEDYNEDLVYVFMTNYNEGKSTDESFTLALQHVKDLKAFDEETKAQQQAQYDAEAREAEANKQAEAQTQQPTTPTKTPEEVKNSGSDGSVPLTAEESKAVETPAKAEAVPGVTLALPIPSPRTNEQSSSSESWATNSSMVDFPSKTSESLMPKSPVTLISSGNSLFLLSSISTVATVTGTIETL